MIGALLEHHEDIHTPPSEEIQRQRSPIATTTISNQKFRTTEPATGSNTMAPPKFRAERHGFATCASRLWNDARLECR